MDNENKDGNIYFDPQMNQNNTQNPGTQPQSPNPWGQPQQNAGWGQRPQQQPQQANPGWGQPQRPPQQPMQQPQQANPGWGQPQRPQQPQRPMQQPQQANPGWGQPQRPQQPAQQPMQQPAQRPQRPMQQPQQANPGWGQTQPINPGWGQPQRPQQPAPQPQQPQQPSQFGWGQQAACPPQPAQQPTQQPAPQPTQQPASQPMQQPVPQAAPKPAAREQQAFEIEQQPPVFRGPEAPGSGWSAEIVEQQPRPVTRSVDYKFDPPSDMPEKLPSPEESLVEIDEVLVDTSDNVESDVISFDIDSAPSAQPQSNSPKTEECYKEEPKDEAPKTAETPKTAEAPQADEAQDKTETPSQEASEQGKDEDGDAFNFAPIPATASETIMALSARVEALTEQLKQKSAAEKKMSELFDKMYDELQQYKNDLYGKLLQPFVSEVIGIIEDTSRFAERNKDADAYRLMEFVKGIPSSLEEVLLNNGVELFEDESEKFNPKTQRALKTEPTSNQALDNVIAERRRKGFWWNGRVIRPELVVVYKYSPSHIAMQ